LAKNGLMPFFVVFLCSIRHRFRMDYRPADLITHEKPLGNAQGTLTT